jgi:hypothetical protein
MIILTIVRHGESTGMSVLSDDAGSLWADTMVSPALDNVKAVWAGSADAPLSSHGAS